MEDQACWQWDLGADSEVSRGQFSWDTGRRQEWYLEGGDLISETAETLDFCLSSSQCPRPWCPLSSQPHPVGLLCSFLSLGEWD